MFFPTGGRGEQDRLLQQCHHLPPPPPPPLLMSTMETNKSWNKPAIELAPNCPRCASSNTKFCYYNNYSLSQPRYFCKACRRYWTKGGSLRNVPVGGGCRKKRRSNKSVRLPHREHPSSMSSNNSQDSGGERSESSNGDSAAQQGLDIDMAVVFAKFLNNQDAAAESGCRRNDSVESSESPPSCFDMETVRNDYHRNQSDVVVEELELELVPEHYQEYQRIEEVVVGNDVNEFGRLDSLLGDQVEQDVFWSDDSMQNFPWQLPMGCLQELDAFPSDDDDQSRFSMTNLMNDNWSSLDLYSGSEIFSRS